jgi:hypothetical protein
MEVHDYEQFKKQDPWPAFPEAMVTICCDGKYD